MRNLTALVLLLGILGGILIMYRSTCDEDGIIEVIDLCPLDSRNMCAMAETSGGGGKQ